MNSTKTAAGAENPDSHETLTTEAAAELLGVAIRTTLEWRKNGVLPPDCLPQCLPRTRRLRWPASALREFAAGRRPTQGGDHA